MVPGGVVIPWRNFAKDSMISVILQDAVVGRSCTRILAFARGYASKLFVIGFVD